MEIYLLFYRRTFKHIIQLYFTRYEYASDFVVRFNTEFEQSAWTVTITRWQIISTCHNNGFSIRVIYASLNRLINIGFDSEALTLEYVYDNILAGAMFVDISGLVDFKESQLDY